MRKGILAAIMLAAFSVLPLTGCASFTSQTPEQKVAFVQQVSPAVESAAKAAAYLALKDQPKTTIAAVDGIAATVQSFIQGQTEIDSQTVRAVVDQAFAKANVNEQVVLIAQPLINGVAELAVNYVEARANTYSLTIQQKHEASLALTSRALAGLRQACAELK